MFNLFIIKNLIIYNFKHIIYKKKDSPEIKNNTESDNDNKRIR